MNAAKFFLGNVLLVMSLNAGAEDSALTNGSQTAESANAQLLNVLRAAPCKTNGDGTYVEMITTMASVLPPELGDALLARYCEECFKRKFQVSQKR